MLTPNWAVILPAFFFVMLPCAKGQHGVGKNADGPGSTCRVERLANNVNTPADEMAAFRHADKFYFTAVREVGRNKRKSFRALSVVGDDAANLLAENPREFSRQVAHLATNVKADRMYYTLCRGVKTEGLEDCQIWYRDRNYDGSWGPASLLPIEVNMPRQTAMQPTFGYDFQTDKEVLFFVSDRPGGQGGLDIWVSEIRPGIGSEEDRYGEPINLPINSAGDDRCPFFDTQTQMLFFSSNGRRCYGGFDIFHTKKEEGGGWAMPINLKAPFNSAFDEQCFFFHHASGRAYFSSDRPSADCTGNDCRNFDVFRAEMQAELRLSILDASNNTPLTNCHVELVEAKTKRIERTLLNWPEAEASFDIPIGKTHTVIVSKLGYEPVFLDVLAGPNEVFATVKRDVRLKPMGAVGEKKPDGN